MSIRFADMARGLIMYLTLALSCILVSVTDPNNASAQDPKDRIDLVRNDTENRVDVLIDGGLFTSYIFPKTIKKPVLYPVITSSGIPITRGYPLDPKPFEKVDHPHHVGIWFNHGDVNNLDFWNNSDSIPVEKRHDYGTIYHRSIDKVESGNDMGTLEITSDWKRPDGKTILVEHTIFHFSGQENKRYIDRTTTLTAQDIDVTFEDSKEGMMAIRVIRELEQEVGGRELLLDNELQPVMMEPKKDGLSKGIYRSSEGLEGNPVWGTRANWVKLGSVKDKKPLGIVMMDHPDNPNHPTHWMARGYGLFAANPLGSRIYTQGKEIFNRVLKSGESLTFRYRVFIYNDMDPDDAFINKEYQTFINRH